MQPKAKIIKSFYFISKRGKDTEMREWDVIADNSGEKARYFKTSWRFWRVLGRQLISLVNLQLYESK